MKDIKFSDNWKLWMSEWINKGAAYTPVHQAGKYSNILLR